MFKFSTILGRFNTYTIALLTIPPAIFLVFFYSFFKNEAINDAYSDIRDEIAYKQTALNGWIEHHKALIDLVASSPRLLQDQERLLQFFQAFLTAHTDFKSIVYFDRNGDYKMSSPALHSGNVADRAYFTRAKNGQTTVTSPLISRLTGDHIIVVTSPVHDNNGDFDGVLVGAIKFKSFLNEFSLSETISTTRPFLVEATNHTLLSPNNTTQSTVVMPPTDTDGAAGYINSNGVKVLGSSALVNEDKWIIVSEKPYSHTLKKMELFLLIFAATSGASLIILIPVMKGHTTTLVRPITAIASISTEMLNDPTKSDCPYISMANCPVEIVSLYQNFCNMAHKISIFIAELEQRSLHDPLTSLANRRCLEAEGHKIIEVCRRNGSPCTCMVLDLDHFKRVNDTYGHLAGDAALQTVSKIIKRNTRLADTCARFGGEEFAILATSTPVDKAINIAERIRTEIESTKVVFNEFSFHITASIGIFQLEIKDQPSAQILEDGIKNADKAMYMAKQNGRNRIEIWSNSSEEPTLAPGTEA